MSINEQVIAIAALLIAATAICMFSYRIYKVARRIDDTLGTDKQGRTVSERLARVEHQLFPNGGSSLTDKINRVESEQKTMQGEISAIKATLNAYVAQGK